MNEERIENCGTETEKEQERRNISRTKEYEPGIISTATDTNNTKHERKMSGGGTPEV